MSKRYKVLAEAGGYLVVERQTTTVTRYVAIVYKTAKAAEFERADLLRYHAKDSPWRARLCIQRPDGTIYNPEQPA